MVSILEDESRIGESFESTIVLVALSKIIVLEAARAYVTAATMRAQNTKFTAEAVETEIAPSEKKSIVNADSS